MLNKIVPLLKIFKDLTVKMSDRYANASIIIPEIITVKTTLEHKDTKKMLFGVVGTLNKLLEEMNCRYAVYLDNPNLILATFFDPRYKHWPFRNQLDTVEKLVVERFLEHEKDKKMFEENNPGEVSKSSRPQKVADIPVAVEEAELTDTSRSKSKSLSLSSIMANSQLHYLLMMTMMTVKKLTPMKKSQ